MHSWQVKTNNSDWNGDVTCSLMESLSVKVRLRTWYMTVGRPETRFQLSLSQAQGRFCPVCNRLWRQTEQPIFYCKPMIQVSKDDCTSAPNKPLTYLLVGFEPKHLWNYTHARQHNAWSTTVIVREAGRLCHKPFKPVAILFSEAIP